MNAFILAMPMLALAAQEAQPPAVVPTRLNLDVVAVDRDGAPVRDLKPLEFEVWISGYRVPVEEVAFVTADSSPRTIVLLLDDMAVGPDLAVRVREAARTVVKRMGDRDRVSVISAQGSRVSDAGDRAALLQAIDHYRPQGFPLRIEDAGEHVLRLLASVAGQMNEIPGRKAIVAIGAAWMFDTPLPPPGLRDLHQVWLAAMRSMAAANASLYVIDPVGLRPLGGIAYGGDSGFANETGGYAFVNTNDAAAAAARIFEETGTYYILRMSDPPVQRAADLRKVEIKVLRKGVTVRARRGIPGKR